MRFLLAASAVVFFGACRVSIEDADFDGVPTELDCDDDNPFVSPDAAEICDGIDNDCNGIIDDAVDEGTTYYADQDGDGFGNPDQTIVACDQPDGYAALADDCDDALADVFPGAPEDDCSGTIDRNCDGSVGAVDADGDGYAACEDCNDAVAAINPGATEICDLLDNDCDGQVDGSTATDASPFYADADADGFGDPDQTVLACSAPTGFVSTDTDCDDTVATINPGALETCNSADDNCDGEVDEATAVDARTFYTDADADGFGDLSSPVRACEAPLGTSSLSTDCDDTRATVNPVADELCNGIDDDCDRLRDESAVDAVAFYLDADGDSYGNPNRVATACSAPNGYVADATDCDDLDITAFPGAPEVCDGDDDDCDGLTDEPGSEGEATFYADADQDGWGDRNDAVRACTAPAGRVDNAGDCDDTRDFVRPNGTEVCNGIDDDCNRRIDDDPADALTFYADFDEDGYGSGTFTTQACEAPPGYADEPGDCNDLSAAVNPGADERCNDIDDDCDRTIDEDDAVDAPVWYVDADADRYGVTDSGAPACTQPRGTTATPGDCNDDDPAINPGAPELCNGIDDDCSGEPDELPEIRVWDGSDPNGADLTYEYSPVEEGEGVLTASWSPDDRANGYQLAVGTEPLATDVADWTSVGSDTTGSIRGLSLDGAWEGAEYFVSVRPVRGRTPLTCAAVSANGVRVAEARVWDGSTDALRPSDDMGGFNDNWPVAGLDAVYGAHYFETVRIDSTVRVQGWGFEQSVGENASPTSRAVIDPADGWLAVYANTIDLGDNALLTASGRGYGGGGGGGAGCNSNGERGHGGIAGLGGAGGLAVNAGCDGSGGGGGGSPGGTGGSALSPGGSGTVTGGGGGGSGQWGAGNPGGNGGSPAGGGAAGVVGVIGMTGQSRTTNSSANGGAGEFGIGGGGGGSRQLSGASGGGGGGGGYGAGGGGGNESQASGGGGGGTGGFGGGTGTNGLPGAGPFAGTGSPGVQNVRATPGLPGGYAGLGINGDLTTDRSWRLGSGGGGGGSSNSQAAGGGGAAGGGAIVLHAATRLTVAEGARLVANGAGGGGGAGDDNSARVGGAGGAGAGGTLILEAPSLTVNSALPNLSARGGNGSTVNGGTIKLFYDRFSGVMPTDEQAGRVYDAGASSYEPAE